MNRTTRRQLADVLAVARQDIEGVKLDFVIVLAAVQAVEIGEPSIPSSIASPSMTNELARFFSAASTISG